MICAAALLSRRAESRFGGHEIAYVRSSAKSWRRVHDGEGSDDEDLDISCDAARDLRRGSRLRLAAVTGEPAAHRAHGRHR